MKKWVLLGLVLFLLVTPLINSQEFGDSNQCSAFTSGLTISVAHPVVAKIGEDVTFSMFVYDAQGKKKSASDTTCTIGLAGSQGEPAGFLNESDLIVIPSPIDGWTGVFDKGNFTETTNLGFIVRCEVVNSGGCFEAHFEVTKTGEKPDTFAGLIYLILLVGDMFLLFLTIWGATFIPWRRPPQDTAINVNYWKYVKYALWLMVYFEMMWFFNLSINLARNFLFLDVTFTFFKMMYFILIAGFYPLLIISAIAFLISIFNNFKWKKVTNR